MRATVWGLPLTLTRSPSWDGAWSPGGDRIAVCVKLHRLIFSMQCRMTVGAHRHEVVP